MPMVNFHSARVRDPDDFLDDKKAWATITIKPGVELVTAKLKKDGMSGPMTAQAYRFDKDKFTVDQAKKWLKKHKVKTVLFEPAKQDVKEADGVTKDENVDELCKTPGLKIRSKGKGRGLARGRGKGPVGVPFSESTTMADIAVRVTEKCWGKIWARKGKRRTEMKEAKGEVVATSNGGSLYSMRGSYEDLREKVRKALVDNQMYGKYPDVVSTFPDKVFVSTEDNKYFVINWRLEGDEVKLGTVQEIERQVKFIVKEMAERVKASLFAN